MSNPNHANRLDQVALTFSDWRPLRHVEDPLHKDLSAVARVGDSLFLACDETASIERLRRLEDGSFGDHRHYTLNDFVDLPAGAEGEMDIEGLCVEGSFFGSWVPILSSGANPSGMKAMRMTHSRAWRAWSESQTAIFSAVFRLSRRRRVFSYRLAQTRRGVRPGSSSARNAALSPAGFPMILISAGSSRSHPRKTAST